MLTQLSTLTSDVNQPSIHKVDSQDVYISIGAAQIDNTHDFDNTTSNLIKSEYSLAFRQTLFFTLLLSAMLHALTFYLVSLHIQTPSFEQDITTPIIIQAKLYTAASSPKTASQLKTTKPINSKQTVELEIKEPVKFEENVRNVKIETLSTIIDEPIEKLSQEQLNKLLQSLVEKPSIQPKSVFHNIASKHIKQLTQDKQNDIANQAFKKLYYDKAHPEIKSALKNFLTLDEQLQKSIKIDLNCNKTSSKVLVFISEHVGVKVDGSGNVSAPTGGPLKCRKNDDIKSFIKQRLEQSNSLQPG